MKKLQSFNDTYISIDNFYSAITIVFNGVHAGLIIETVHPDSQAREVRYAHFLPMDTLESEHDYKRICQTLKNLSATPRAAYVACKKFYNVNTIEEVMKVAELTGISSTTYQVTRRSADKMIEKIIKQHEKTEPVPEFQLRGIAYGNGNYFNCRSWVRDMLKCAGIEVPVSWWDETSSDTLHSAGTSVNCNIL
jgi:hypothetical protein